MNNDLTTIGVLDGNRPIISINAAKSLYPKLISEQMDRALINLVKLSEHLGHSVDISSESPNILYCKNIEAMDFLLTQFAEEGYIDNQVRQVTLTHGMARRVTVKPKGFNKVAEIERQPAVSNNAFIAMCLMNRWIV